MLERADYPLLVAIAAALLISAYFAHKSASRHRSKAQKYRLFKVRDELVYLVATEQLSCDEPVFNLMYGAVNSYLQDLSRISLTSFVRALERGRQKGIDPAADEEVEQLQHELERKPPEVQRVVLEFYQSVVVILYENSRILRLLLKFDLLLRLIKACRRWFGPKDGPRPTPLVAYAYHRDYKKAAKGLSSHFAMA
jgi:hypothetical protein